MIPAAASLSRIQTRVVKTLDPIALGDLLLLSCRPAAPESLLAHVRSLFLYLSHSISHTFPWNTVIRAHADRSPQEALSLFSAMRARGVPLDGYTFPFLLKACCRHPCPDTGLRAGLGAHGLLAKLGFTRYLHVGNALVSFYGSFGLVNLALRAFDEMSSRDVVSWSAVISCLVSNGLDRDALEVFQAMQVVGGDMVVADEVTMVSVVTATGNVAAPQLATWVYSYVLRRNLDLTVTMGTALVVMLSRCGHVNRAAEVFDRMPVRNAHTWTALIMGFAEHGRSSEAVRAFDQMLDEGFPPDNIAFIGVLMACSHGGLLEEGKRLFESIKRVHGMEPSVEHYGCVVDLMGRAGNLEEARQFIERMDVKPNAVIWRTLLGHCVSHGNVELAEYAKKKVLELDPVHDGDYVLLSNVHGGTEQWLEKARLRAQMWSRGISKMPGRSVPY